MKKEKNSSCGAEGCRLGKVGGQAVIEGVMMKAGNRTVTSCRKSDKSIVVADDNFVSVRQKHKWLGIPLLRGIVNFIEMMILSVKTLNASADALGIEEEETKFEKWLKKHFGVGIVDVIMVIGVVLGLALSLFLFMFLPIFVADFFNSITVKHLDFSLGAWQKVIEGVLKAGIFVLYLWLVALMPDIKRTFMYHGAEHKTIACFEAGDELTPENAMKHSRFHPRCGTSFMFFMILLGIVAGLCVNAVLPGLNKWQYTGIRLLILPLIVGLGYEFIMYAGKHNNFIVKMLSAPGLWVQRLTTKEPTLDMLEVAIVSTKCALRDEFPEFREYFESRAWEPVAEQSTEAEGAENTDGAETVAVAEQNTEKAVAVAEEQTAPAEQTVILEAAPDESAPESAAPANESAAGGNELPEMPLGENKNGGEGEEG